MQALIGNIIERLFLGCWLQCAKFRGVTSRKKRRVTRKIKTRAAQPLGH
ncbi:hypothetical protein ABIC02_007712 [Bradyrhizobium sp. RT5a]